jgi:hypothetical protein
MNYWDPVLGRELIFNKLRNWCTKNYPNDSPLINNRITTNRLNPLKPEADLSVRTAKRTQHFTITKINWLTLFKEIIAVYTENHMKHMDTLCEQIVELLKVKAGGTYSYHWALKG